MGFVGALIVGIIGFIIAFLINLIPVDIFIKVIPICWIPSFDCTKWYDKVKTYLIILLLTIVLFFMPFL